MNCFYHTDRPAVGQCANCGKFLCKECVSKYKPILCDECFGEIHTQEVKRNTNESFLLVVCAAAFGVLFVLCLLFGGLVGMGDAVDRIGAAYGMAFFVYGWRGWDSLRRKYNVSLELSIPLWVCYFVLKCAFSAITGGVFYLITLIQVLAKRNA